MSYSWANAAGGNWNAPGNWSPSGVPGAGDSAAITLTGNYTVTVNDSEAVGTLTLGASSADATVQTLNLVTGGLAISNFSTGTAQGTVTVTGGTLAAEGLLTLGGPLNWTGGALSGNVKFNGGSINGSFNLTAALVNSGTLDWSGAFYFYGGALTNLGTINVAPGTSTYFESGSPDIDNDGLINISGPGTTKFSSPFNNYGTVAINGGTLNLENGGTESNAFTLTTNATLELTAGTFNFDSCAILGQGILAVNGGTAHFTGASSFTGVLNLAGGTLNLDCDGPLTPGSVNLTSGAEGGTQTLQVTNQGAFSWTGGSVMGTVLFNGGSMNGGLNLYGALVNSGSLLWAGSLYMYGGVLTNLGTINMTPGVGVASENGTPDFDNAGQLNISGAGTCALNLPFNNRGVVAVTGGTLRLTGGGTETNAFVLDSSATLEVGGGTFDFNSCAITGLGTLLASGGTVNFTGTSSFAGVLNLTGSTFNMNGNGALSPSSATITGGTENGSQTLALTNSGAFSWTGGNVTGTVLFNGGSINGGLNLSGALVNTGTLAWTGSLYMYGGVLTNFGTINAASGAAMVTENGSPNFDNDGAMNVAGPGTSTLGVPFNNHGTVALGGGTLKLSTGGSADNVFTLTGGSTLDFGGGSYDLNSGAVISGAGNFSVDGGTVVISGSASVSTPLELSGGTLNISGSSPLTASSASITGGTLEGSQPLQVQGAGGFSWTGGGIPGTVLFNGGSINGGLNLSGTLVNSGTLAWGGALYFYGGVLTNFGTINLAPATITALENGSPVLFNSGQLNVSGPGTSILGIPLYNAGTLNIQSGVLSVTGDYTSTNGTLLFGISSATTFGALSIAGNATLNGTLDAVANGYAPSSGDSFPLITYGGESGIFSIFNFPANVDWQVNYGGTVFSLTSLGLKAPFVTLQALTTSEMPDGFTLLMLGPIGSNYTLQACSDQKLTNWVTVTNFTTVDTSYYYTDASAASHSFRAFRAMIVQ